jgi:hypothetical protein
LGGEVSAGMEVENEVEIIGVMERPPQFDHERVLRRIAISFVGQSLEHRLLSLPRYGSVRTASRRTLKGRYSPRYVEAPDEQ